VIAPSALKGFGLGSGYEPRLRVGGIGGQVAAQATAVKDFAMGGSMFHNIEFLVVDGADAGGLAGILGQNILGAADVEYDLANGVARIFKPQGCSGAAVAYWTDRAASLDLLSDSLVTNHKIQAVGAVNGRAIRITLDTGSDRSELTLAAAAHAGVTPNTPGAVYAGQSRGIGHDLIDGWIAPFGRFTLGGETLEDVRIRFGGLELHDTDMLLGADFFLSHRVYVANSQHKIYFTYNGGPVFQLTARRGQASGPEIQPQPVAFIVDDINTPKDAAAFERRGAAFMGRLDYAQAIEDFSRAHALNPTDPEPLFNRGMAQWDNHQPGLAMADFEQVLKLKPDDPAALLARGSLYAQAGDRARARSDFEAIRRMGGDEAHIALALADADYRFGFYEDAIAAYDRWIATHPQGDLGVALLRRCQTRVMLKTDLDKALADCSAVLKANPHEVNAMHMRGLVRYLRGDLDPAIADLDADLALQPRNAIALYVRGLAKQKKGLAVAGDADIQAATLIMPKIADQARRLGF
jgi:tetratricopeptide (TPR) repeat protein